MKSFVHQFHSFFNVTSLYPPKLSSSEFYVAQSILYRGLEIGDLACSKLTVAGHYSMEEIIEKYTEWKG